MSRNPPIQSVNADLFDAALYADDVSTNATGIGRAPFFIALSHALDLAVDRAPGHAERVAFTSLALAADLHHGGAGTTAVLYAALLHDIGAAVAAPDAGGDGLPCAQSSFSFDPMQRRARSGRAITVRTPAGMARLIGRLGLDDAVVRFLAPVADGLDAETHEEDDLMARIVRTAAHFETLAGTDASPLLLRRVLPERLAAIAPPGDEVTAAMLSLAGSDVFWLGFYDNDLAAHLVRHDPAAALSLDEMLSVGGVISTLLDARAGRPEGHSWRVAALAEQMATRAGLTPRRARMVQLAALLQDLGTLGVPTAILQKPDILNVDEMAVMQQHTVIARDILSEVPGLGTAAWWIGCHHERIDGKGYPSMLSGDQVPTEAQIIGLAEVYCALTIVRPHRMPMSHDAAIEVVRGMGGARFEPRLCVALEAVAGAG
jgi:HD-GYP domain-containing protein (c-di-GMP phosphodiesterase class II)